MSEAMKLSSLPSKNEVPRNTSFIGVDGSGTAARALSRSVFVMRPAVTDLDDATLTGYYCLNRKTVGESGKIANLPDTKATYGILLVFEDGTNNDQEFVQVIFSISTPPYIYIRKKGSSSGWSKWHVFQGTEMTSVLLGG